MVKRERKHLAKLADYEESLEESASRTRERRETRRETRGAQAYGAGAGWLASRLAHRECKCEREVASGVQRTRSGGTLRVNRRKQPREAGKLRSRVSTVRGAEAAGRGSSFREQASATRAAACFSPAPSRCGLRRGH
ncbi:hypothetical protein NDU88_003581 [Pleurodeles waltl]|uniref:Uncharacterized protein n=1 Tax=Pleurodeles waltl TaxID=8319 RepID=A0AAV7SGB6_PLEWA|nr:hypothetical protein NDU88_003581 [Pleurodeles waltl]